MCHYSPLWSGILYHIFDMLTNIYLKIIQKITNNKNARWRIRATAQKYHTELHNLSQYRILGFRQFHTTLLQFCHYIKNVRRPHMKRHFRICFLYIFYICHIQHLFQSISLVNATIHEQNLLSSVFVFTETNYIPQAPPSQSVR